MRAMAVPVSRATGRGRRVPQAVAANEVDGRDEVLDVGVGCHAGIEHGDRHTRTRERALRLRCRRLACGVERHVHGHRDWGVEGDERHAGIVGEGRDRLLWQPQREPTRAAMFVADTSAQAAHQRPLRAAGLFAELDDHVKAAASLGRLEAHLRAQLPRPLWSNRAQNQSRRDEDCSSRG